MSLTRTSMREIDTSAALDLSRRLFQALEACATDGRGITRMPWGPGEAAAHALLRDAGEAAGLEASVDAAGNLYLTLPGRDRTAPRWMSGSHVDTVPDGGNFDGAAGAVAALAAAVALKEAGHVPRCDVTAMVIRAEEVSSWFTGHTGGHLGSRAALGLLWPDELTTAHHIALDKPVGEVIDDAGFDARALRDGPPHLSAANVAGFLEIHIEQGPVLIDRELPIGIVTGIRGTVRLREARCVGAYTHSGAVPHELRQDAVLATVALAHRLDEAWSEARATGEDLVVTMGKIHTDRAVESLSKVPGECAFTLDIRSQSAATLSRMKALVESAAETIGAERRVRFELGRIAVGKPAPMDETLRAMMREVSADLAIPTDDVACGAGHDSADFHHAGIPAAMIFVRNTGGSHNPSEHMEMSDYAEALRVLTETLRRLTA
ncbi:hydantoinase/carbamoylase family amidase [Acuticoccus mangrovi]|uniref:Hydantoinase/carbamoylase family amidase n=1 Tax=Acuticoccus mangrovi TaxID=2796142 RepID=A0A934IVK2_9HYPH|nr:hydantoinase/carbamoylase family amidase [Acuticoccus mangrovi]MBJ3778539.1 hydantoinase/carbamoylase family amidase [Acuticoccus mangrovi]